MLSVITFLVILFLILPIFVILPISFSSAEYLTFPPPGFSLQWYIKLFSDYQWIGSIQKSLLVGILTTTLSLILGIMAAIGIKKSKFKWKDTVQNIFLIPILVPSIIIAIAIYKFESQVGLIGTTLGIVIAHTILAFPFVFVTVLSGLNDLDVNLENAALILGANPWQALFRVTLPIISPSVISGALFAFSTSFDELVVTLFISGISSKTLPVQMWDGIRNEIDPTIAAVSSIIISSLIFIMIVSQFLKINRQHHNKTERNENLI